MNYSDFGSNDWTKPVAGFNPSKAGSDALGGLGSENAALQSGLAGQALGAMGQIKAAEIQADAIKKQAEAAQRASMWSTLGSIGSSALTAGIGAAFPTKIKLV